MLLAQLRRKGRDIIPIYAAICKAQPPVAPSAPKLLQTPVVFFSDADNDAKKKAAKEAAMKKMQAKKAAMKAAKEKKEAAGEKKEEKPAKEEKKEAKAAKEEAPK